MRLTKSERHTAYIIMLAEYEAEEKAKYQISQGLCSMSHDLFFEEKENFNWADNVNLFPEYKAKKPADAVAYRSWFGVGRKGRLKRIELLKECIIETA